MREFGYIFVISHLTETKSLMHMLCGRYACTDMTDVVHVHTMQSTFVSLMSANVIKNITLIISFDVVIVKFSISKPKPKPKPIRKLIKYCS